MRTVNKVILVGRLGADPVQRTTAKGAQWVHFPLATSYRVQRKQEGDAEALDHQKTDEMTCWHQVTVWGKEGEACAEYLKKGDPVFLEGSIVTRSYQDKNGIQKYVVEIRASQVNFLSRPEPIKESPSEVFAEAIL